MRGWLWWRCKVGNVIVVVMASLKLLIFTLVYGCSDVIATVGLNAFVLCLGDAGSLRFRERTLDLLSVGDKHVRVLQE